MPSFVRTTEQQPDELPDVIVETGASCYVCRKVFKAGDSVLRLKKRSNSVRMLRHVSCPRRVKVLPPEETVDA